MTQPTLTNADRADRAYKTLCFYITLVSGDQVPLDEPDEACASDIVADLMHLFGHDEMQTVFNRATNHYTYETEEEDELNEEDNERTS
jgi:hypothetical protein